MRISNERLYEYLALIAILTYVVAACFYAFHSVGVDTQYDTQVVLYAEDLINASRHGTLGEALLQIRKYPMGYIVPFTAAFKLAFAFVDANRITGVATSRIFTLFYGAGCLVLLWNIAKRFGYPREALLLLLTSVLFLLFTSAVRPHIPVTFATLLTLWLSLRAQEEPSTLRTALAFAAATFAAMTLQSGFIAFVFPVWIILNSGIHVRSIARAAGWVVPCVLLAFLIGYPFLLRPLYELDAGTGVLGHDVGLYFTLLQPLRVLLSLLGGEIVLLGAAFMTIAAIVRWRELPDPRFAPILLYIALFILVFAFHTSAAGRFFLPILPMLALLGAISFAHLDSRIKLLAPLLIIVVCGKLTWLALTSDTYQTTSAFLRSRAGTTMIVSQSPHFFLVDQKNVKKETSDLREFSTVLRPDYAGAPSGELSEWSPCFHAVASRTTDEIVLLWNDTPWALWHVFEASRLGPNMTTYCRPGTT